MNKRGFTLVELLAVLAILGFIMVIAIPTITSSMQRTKVKHNAEREKVLLSAAEVYVNDHKNSFFPFLREEGSFCYVKIQTLIDGNYLNDDLVKDVNDEDSFLGTIKISGGSFVQYDYNDKSVSIDDLCPNKLSDFYGDDRALINDKTVSGNVFFYYNDVNDGPKKISRSCTINSNKNSCEVEVPNEVSSSKGPYQSGYAGLVDNIKGVNAYISSDKKKISVSKEGNLSNVNVILFAFYQGTVTEYYNNGTSGVSRTLYRNEYFVDENNISTVLTYDKDGLSNFKHENGVGGSVFKGYSVDNNTAIAYNLVEDAAKSNANTLYSVYGLSVKYAVGVHVSSIGSSSGGCLMNYGDNSCGVTTPSISASVGYTSVGWGTSSGLTTGTAASSSLTISKNNQTYYGNAKRNFTCSKVGGTTTYAGMNWYTIKNNGTECELVLNKQSVGTGSHNDIASKLNSEYYKGTLKNERDAGLITTWNSDGGTSSGLASGVYWIGDGKIYHSGEWITNITCNYSTIYSGMDNKSQGLLNGVNKCTSVTNNVSSAGILIVNNANSSFVTKKATQDGGVYGSTHYRYFVVNSIKSDTSLVIGHYGAGGNWNASDDAEYTVPAGKTFTVYACGNKPGTSWDFHGKKVMVISTTSSSRYHYKNVVTGTDTTYSVADKRWFSFAGNTGCDSESGANQTYHHDKKAPDSCQYETQCKIFYNYTISNNQTYDFHYRLHVVVKL